MHALEAMIFRILCAKITKVAQASLSHRRTLRWRFKTHNLYHRRHDEI